MNSFCVFCVCACFATLCYILKIYLSRRRLVELSNSLPSIKLRFYHLLGHVQLIFGHRMIKRKNNISPHVYDFMALNGYNHIFSKHNCCIIWQTIIPFVVVHKADSVEVILSNSTELKKAWFYENLNSWLGTGLLMSYDEKWRKRRKMLTPAFHFNILKDFLSVFNKQSNILAELLNKHTQDEFTDITPLITNCSLDIICESILGKEMHSQILPSNEYVKAVTYLTSNAFERVQRPWLWNDFIFSISPFGKRFQRNVNIVRDFTIKLIAERKEIMRAQLTQKSQEDVQEEESKEFQSKRRKKALLDLLLEEHLSNNSISDEGICEEVDTFTFEGHDTTSVAISWCLYFLGLHPWVQDKVHQELDSIFSDEDQDVTMDNLRELKYLECVIKETLRLHPSVPVFGRTLRNDVKIEGHTLSKDSTCMVNAWYLHRNPDVFPNPEKFDPDRFAPENCVGRNPFAYVPFSAGPRNCIGQRFALMEAKTVLSTMLRKYKVRSLDPRDEVLMVDEIVLRPLNGLRLQIRRRHQPFDFHSVYYTQ